MKRNVIFLFLIGAATILSSPAQAGFFDRLFSNGKNNALKIRSNQAPAATTRATEVSQPMSVKSFTNQNIQNTAPISNAANVINNKDLQVAALKGDFRVSVRLGKNTISIPRSVDRISWSIRDPQKGGLDMSLTATGYLSNTPDADIAVDKACATSNATIKVKLLPKFNSFSPEVVFNPIVFQSDEALANKPASCSFMWNTKSGEVESALNNILAQMERDNHYFVSESAEIDIEGLSQDGDHFVSWKKTIMVYLELAPGQPDEVYSEWSSIYME